MANFSVNQARQLFVGNTVVNSEAALAEANPGSIFLKTTTDDFVVVAKTGLGEIVRSDRFTKDNVEWVNVTPAAKLYKTGKVHEVTVNSEILNSDSKVPAGYDYILRVAFYQYVGLSEEDTYYKYAEVYPTSALEPSAFYAKLAISLAKNASKDINPLFKISLKTASDPVEVTAATKEEDLNGTYTGLLISEQLQEWHLGTMSHEVLPFTVSSVKVVMDGIELPWAEVSTSTEAIESANGKTIADLEHFCMGERGDIYRNMGWPNVVPTKYLVDPTANYDVVDIQFFYAGDAEDIQKSPRTLTIVVPAGSGATIGSALTAAGLVIKTAPVSE